MEVPPTLVEKARTARSITVLTGAGMSAESGLPTFRDAQTGLWARYDPMTLATPEAWREDPALVWAWYQKRGAMLQTAEPNAGHLALATWSKFQDIRIVTQNVDDLHERAGSTNVIHVHGSLLTPYCDSCHTPYPADVEEPTGERVPPPKCACGGLIRPGVVWFGEMLPEDAFARAIDAAQRCDLMIVVGTSGIVYPAAGLAQLAQSNGASVAEINPAETEASSQVDIRWRATAATALPALLAQVNP
ncbi:NAD-dependent deacylase [Skermania sp. ID1734]|uniref:SIR2 family NAD-dependent protein deacylase n=1 Tax=Skermania sp. ID1734 TaxID=2597516 RepID=UPI00117E26F2|nr:NAD-dependent deacylase [Skermania sp. ID1734]TSE01579.1 NAD-dependent deacylase [Skermania sp. ID1734]